MTIMKTILTKVVRVQKQRKRQTNKIPVLVKVWPLYDAQRRSSSSNSSDPLSSSSLLHLTRSRKLVHSSEVIDEKYLLMGEIFSKMKFELKIFYNEASNRSKTKTWKNLLQIEED